MSSKRVALITALAVEIGSAAQSHAAPTDTTGGLDLSAWKSGAYGFDACAFCIGPAIGGTVNISAGAYVVGSIGANLYRVADINGGAAVQITTTIGYTQRLVDVAAFDKLWLVDTGDANTHKYKAIPLESLE